MLPTSSAPGSKPALTNPELAEPWGFLFAALQPQWHRVVPLYRILQPVT
jgi:hypothetical protein